jgi:hypothetical protein
MARRSDSGRGARGYQSRLVNTREPKQRILIVCEGSKTERYYFEELRRDHRLNAEVIVRGLGLDPSQLVETAQTESRLDDYDQVWCVFDRDTWPAQNFNNALAQARRLGIGVAYSNEAFELWYLLHFYYYDTGIPRQEYIERLDGLLGHPYAKNSRDTYRELRSRQEDALRNARTLLAQYEPPDPANDNPSTTVHLLVEELLRHAR